jgi:hypothetical protein
MDWAFSLACVYQSGLGREWDGGVKPKGKGSHPKCLSAPQSLQGFPAILVLAWLCCEGAGCGLSQAVQREVRAERQSFPPTLWLVPSLSAQLYSAAPSPDTC